jgi:hypothetical protein
MRHRPWLEAENLCCKLVQIAIKTAHASQAAVQKVALLMAIIIAKVAFDKRQ